MNKKVAKFEKDPKETKPFGSDVDDEEDFPLVNAQIHVLAGAILIHTKQQQQEGIKAMIQPPPPLSSMSTKREYLYGEFMDGSLGNRSRSTHLSLSLSFSGRTQPVI